MTDHVRPEPDRPDSGRPGSSGSSDRPGSSNGRGSSDPFDWVRELVLADLDAGDVAARLLLAYDGPAKAPEVQLIARSESPHDVVSPLSEMACAIAARPPRRVVWVRRLTAELEARHTPAAAAASIRRRPAVPTGIPDGWSPACPL